MVDLLYKITTPLRVPNLIPRPTLIQRLWANEHARLIAVVAPPGYGKTSLLINIAHTASLPVCWYTLDSYDADTWTFVGYLAAAIEQQFPGCLSQTLMLLQNGEGRPSLKMVITTLVSEIYAISKQFILILDDWHVVDYIDDIKDCITQIVLRCPNCRIILASRCHPSLPNQMLLTARRQFVSIDENMLRFDAAEVAAAIVAESGTDVSDNEAQTLAFRSDGWITGVMLALHATGGDVAEAIDSNLLHYRPVRLFLAEQVFDQQPPDIQDFMCETAMLEHLTVEQCDALRGRTDSWSALEWLLKHRLFVREIRPGILCYHQLFREFLWHQLRVHRPATFERLQQVLVEDYVRQEQWMLAFDLCLKAGNLTLLRDVLHVSGEDLYARGRIETLEHMLSALVPETSSAALLCLQARVAIDRGQLDLAQQVLDQALAYDDVSLPRVRLLQAMLARVQGQYTFARDVAQQVLDDPTATALHSDALRTLGMSLHRLGQPQAAIAALQQAFQIERSSHHSATEAQILHEIAVCYNTMGNLTAAQEACLRAEAIWTTIGNIGRRALTRNTLAMNYALSGCYREAYTTVLAAIEDARAAVVPDYEAAAFSTLGDVCVDLGLWERAAQAYMAVITIGGSAFIRSYSLVMQQAVAIGQHKYEAAARGLDRLPRSVVQQQPALVCLLRARIATSLGNYPEALRWVQQAADQSNSHGSLAAQIQVTLWHAWIISQISSQDDRSVLQVLRHAAWLGEQGGSHAIAAAASLPMRSMLRRFRTSFASAQTWLDLQDQIRYIASNLEVELTQPVIRAHLLGDEMIWINDQPLALGLGRPREALAYLLLHPGGVSRSELSRALWGDDDCEGDTLSRIIYRLRSALPQGSVVTVHRDRYCLDLQVVQIDLDVARFDQLSRVGSAQQQDHTHLEALLEAIVCYRGEFFPSSESGWVVELRERLGRRFQILLRQAAALSERFGRTVEALDLYHQLVALDPTSVAAHAGIMRCHRALNEPGLVIAQYRKLTRTLDEELGIALAIDSEPERIYQSVLMD